MDTLVFTRARPSADAHPSYRCSVRRPKASGGSRPALRPDFAQHSNLRQPSLLERSIRATARGHRPAAAFGSPASPGEPRCPSRTTHVAADMIRQLRWRAFTATRVLFQLERKFAVIQPSGCVAAPTSAYLLGRFRWPFDAHLDDAVADIEQLYPEVRIFDLAFHLPL